MTAPRVVVICAEYWMGSNDVVRIMRLALEDLGAQILELNLGRYPDLVDAPDASAYPRMPKQVRLEKLQPFLDAFRPDVVMCVAGGITFREDEYRDIMERCVTVGITVSDPEAYYLAREIARMGYRRCASQHTWHTRWRELFRVLSEKEGKPWILRPTWRLLVRRRAFPFSD